MLSAKSVDEFIAVQSDEQIEMLEKVRELILTTAPKAEELVSYGVPCYKWNGSLVGFGVQKKGISFYAMNSKMPEAFKNELSAYKFSASTIHINLGQKIPKAVLKKIIKVRMKENEATQLAKKNPSSLKSYEG